MINPYKNLPASLSECLLTKDGLIIGPNNVTMFRSEVNGSFYYMVESATTKKIFGRESNAIREFMNLAGGGVHMQNPEVLGAKGMGVNPIHPQVGYGSSEKSEKSKKKGKKKSSGKFDAPFSKIDSETVDRTNLEQAMEKQDLTVTKLADMVGVHPPAISRLLREPSKSAGDKDPGGRNPGIEIAAKISDILGLPIERAFPDLFKVRKKKKKRKGNRKSGQASKFTSKLDESIELLVSDLVDKDALVLEGLCNVIARRPDVSDMILAALSGLDASSSILECRSTIFNYLNKHINLIKAANKTSLLENLNTERILNLDNVLQFTKLLEESRMPVATSMVPKIRYVVKSLLETMGSANIGAGMGDMGMGAAGASQSVSGAEMSMKNLGQGSDDPTKMADKIKKANEARQEQQNEIMKQREEALDNLQDQVKNIQNEVKVETEGTERSHEDIDQNLDNISAQVADMMDKNSQAAAGSESEQIK